MSIRGLFSCALLFGLASGLSACATSISHDHVGLAHVEIIVESDAEVGEVRTVQRGDIVLTQKLRPLGGARLTTGGRIGVIGRSYFDLEPGLLLFSARNDSVGDIYCTIERVKKAFTTQKIGRACFQDSDNDSVFDTLFSVMDGTGRKLALTTSGITRETASDPSLLSALVYETLEGDEVPYQEISVLYSGRRPGFGNMKAFFWERVRSPGESWESIDDSDGFFLQLDPDKRPWTLDGTLFSAELKNADENGAEVVFTSISSQEPTELIFRYTGPAVR